MIGESFCIQSDAFLCGQGGDLLRGRMKIMITDC